MTSTSCRDQSRLDIHSQLRTQVINPANPQNISQRTPCLRCSPPARRARDVRQVVGGGSLLLPRRYSTANTAKNGRDTGRWIRALVLSSSENGPTSLSAQNQYQHEDVRIRIDPSGSNRPSVISLSAMRSIDSRCKRNASIGDMVAAPK